MQTSTHAAGEIRAAMARQRLTGAQLIEKLSALRGHPMNQAWLSRRLNGDVPLSVDDLTDVAAVLDLRAASLLPMDGAA